ncbi:MAG: RIP metalloprotease RseP [Peptococcaceae bacterium]|jgi:regulator of sigma E protease|nr:RIP metalloprotease RseP [Peptococcaceae bacterium]
MLSFLAVVLVFGLVIFIHELGHFTVAKLTGVKVVEFSLGMGPKLIGYKGKETEYVLRALPVGGLCAMVGEPDGLQSGGEVCDESRRFDRQPPRVRAAITVAGPVMNFVLALVLFVLIYSIVGIPLGYSNRIQEVAPDGAAGAAGVLPGDRITSVNGTDVSDWNGILLAIQNHAGGEMDLVLDRDGDSRSVTLEPRLDPESGRQLIGIMTGPENLIWENLSPGEGISAGFRQTGVTFGVIIQALREMFSGGVSVRDLSGPVGIVQTIAQTAQEGMVSLIFLTAFLSINIGICNLLPIPALDGGRLLFILIEKIIRRPINPKKEGMIHLAGLVALLMLMVVVTYFDVLRLFN